MRSPRPVSGLEPTECNQVRLGSNSELRWALPYARRSPGGAHCSAGPTPVTLPSASVIRKPLELSSRTSRLSHGSATTTHLPIGMSKGPFTPSRRDESVHSLVDGLHGEVRLPYWPVRHDDELGVRIGQPEGHRGGRLPFDPKSESLVEGDRGVEVGNRNGEAIDLLEQRIVVTGS